MFNKVGIKKKKKKKKKRYGPSAVLNHLLKNQEIRSRVSPINPFMLIAAKAPELVYICAFSQESNYRLHEDILQP